MKSEYEILWDSFYESHNDKTGIVEDGALNQTKWLNQKPKILFYYKGTYGYDETVDRYSISNQYERWINDKIRCYKRMAVVSHIIIDGIENHRSSIATLFDKSCYNSLFANPPILKESLSKVAVVNINKESRKETLPYNGTIRDKSRENKNFLKRQLKYLNPQIIICGGLVTVHSLFCDLDYLTTDEFTMDQAQLIDDKIIAPYYSLSYSGCNFEVIRKYCEQIISIYNQNLNKNN